MYSLVLNGELTSVSITLLVGKCHLFQTKPELLCKPYRVESCLSLDSLRVFVGAIGGEAAAISDASVRDLSQLCDTFKFIELPKRVRDWEAEHALIGPVARRDGDEHHRGHEDHYFGGDGETELGKEHHRADFLEGTQRKIERRDPSSFSHRSFRQNRSRTVTQRRDQK
jgi:hypothetical protein